MISRALRVTVTCLRSSGDRMTLRTSCWVMVEAPEVAPPLPVRNAERTVARRSTPRCS